MPYYLAPSRLTPIRHPDSYCYCGTPIGKACYCPCVCFDSRDEASTHLTEFAPIEFLGTILADTIVYVPRSYESERWHRRERGRFDDDTYLALPWRQSVADVDDTNDGYERWQHISAKQDEVETAQFLFAHLALKHPGQIAFTLSDEHGHNDRQTTIRPGKFLERFYPGLLTTAERDRFCAACTEETKPAVLAIARTIADVRTIFNSLGPTFGSCMQRRRSPDYDWQHRMDDNHCAYHPCEVYGDSDLGVAYLGPIAHVTARCVVWPDKQLYYRVYGAEGKLTAALESAGYKHGSLAGARIRHVKLSSGYLLMPYIDGIGHATPTRGGWLTLGTGTIGTQSTCGRVPADGRDDDEDDEIEQGECEHCGDSVDQSQLDDQGGYCEDCNNQRAMCEECNDDIWTNDDEYTSTYDGSLCESCADHARVTCAVEDCENEWIEACFSNRQRRQRSSDGTSDICTHCERTHTYCSGCDTWLEWQGADRCPSCAPDDEDDDQEDEVEQTNAPQFVLDMLATVPEVD